MIPFHILSEAYLNHSSRSTKRHIKPIEKIPLPDELKNKRLVCIDHGNSLIQIFVFEHPNDKYPNETYYMFDAQRPNLEQGSSSIHDVHRAWIGKTEDPDDATPFKYAGEVFIHPPFIGYEEFPQNKNLPFFDANKYDDNQEFQSGNTIFDHPKII